MEQRKFPGLGELCYFEQLENGLPIYVVPKPGYSKAYACFAVSYGGMHRRFRTKQWQDTPAGIAHYLEHKMFDLPDGNAMRTLTAQGASPNAFTSQDLTCYYFSCTEHFEQNLRTLLHFVSTPFFTPESVEKERGIISQEIGMGQDDPRRQVHQNLYRGLYQNHPIRDNVIGTVESIGEITPELLYQCYEAFYHPGNMVLCVAGDIDPKKVFSIARVILPRERKPMAEKDLGGEEPREAAQREICVEMPVSEPNFLLGFKAPPHPDGIEGLRRTLVGELAAELLCGDSSPLHARLYEKGLIHKSFYGGYNDYPGAAVLCLGGESPDPQAVREQVLEEGRALAKKIDPKRFSQLLRGEYGARVRSLNSFDEICLHLAWGHFSGYHYYDFASLYAKITAQEVSAFLAEVIREEQSTLSIVRPKGGSDT